VKFELADFLLSQRILVMNLQGSFEQAPKTRLLPPLGGSWTAANKKSESAQSRPLKSPEIAKF
jgi:hypothetical protein